MTENETPDNEVRYVIDSNCIIEGRNSIYAVDIFPSLWKNMEELVATGELYIPQAVIDEVEKKYDDDPASWVNTHKSNVVALSDKQKSDIDSAFGDLAKKWLRKNNESDLYIIGTAMVLDATVVTLEKPPGDYKIPTICEEKGVKCINLMKLMRREGWVFR